MSLRSSSPWGVSPRADASRRGARAGRRDRLRPAGDRAGRRPAAAPGGGGGGGGGGGQGPAPAKIKLKLKGLKGGKAKVGDRIEAIGTVTPVRRRPAGRGPARQPRRHGAQEDAVRAPGQGQEVRPLQAALEAAGRGAASTASGCARRRPRARPAGSAKSKEFELKFIDLDPGDRGPGGRALQRPAAQAGLLQHRQGHLRLAHRARGDGVPQGQRDGAQLPGDAGDLQSSPPARAASRSATRTPASTPRSTSPSR